MRPSHLRRGTALALLGLFSLPLWAKPGWKFTLDLNGDGRAEKVGLRPFKSGDTTFQQLVVCDSAGRMLFEGPKTVTNNAYADHPLVFGGEFDLGELEVIGDLDGDGKVELIGTDQKSDVSPTGFRLLRWQNRAFRCVKRGCLVPAPQRPATFVWSQDRGAVSWIDHFRATRRVAGEKALQVKVNVFWMADGKVTTNDHWARLNAEGVVLIK